MELLISPDLTQDDILGADHQQVAFKLPAYFLLDAVVHIWEVVRIELIDEDLLRQLDSKTVSVDGDLFHQLTTLDPHWGKTEMKGENEHVLLRAEYYNPSNAVMLLFPFCQRK